MNLGIDLSDKKLYIVDIRFKQYNLDLSKYCTDPNSRILSLTPYSSYLLEHASLHYLTFEDVISTSEFNTNAFNEYHKFEELVYKYKTFSYLLYFLVLTRNKQLYYLELLHYLSSMKKCEIIYVTDTQSIKNSMQGYNYASNNISLLHSFEGVNKIILLDAKDKIFYFKQKTVQSFFKLKYTQNFFKKIIKLIFNKDNLILSYDNIHLQSYFTKKRKVNLKLDVENFQNEYKDFKVLFLNMVQVESSQLINKMYNSFFDSFENFIEESQGEYEDKLLPFVFLSNNSDFLRMLTYKENNVKTFFTQHGSYLHENMTLKHCEIFPADCNFVFNEYTKQLFEKRGASRVEVVGSIDFNKVCKNEDVIYDFVYIAFCSSYTYTGTFSGIKDSNISMDGMNIYNRHKMVIELFGKIFLDKKLCIKIQPSIMLSSMYIPFIELTQKYSNITIEYTTPLHAIIQKSKYIISDYFSSEFINRQLHYNKDIIMFSASPYAINEEIMNDMDKMFLLCHSDELLIDMISNIEQLVKDRERDDKIIEYYSSKQCNTKELMIKVLKEESRGR